MFSQQFFIVLQVRAAFKHKTKVWTLTSSSIRNINVKPFNSDIVSPFRDFLKFCTVELFILMILAYTLDYPQHVFYAQFAVFFVFLHR